MRKPLVWVIVVGVLATIAVGFLFSRAPQPEISVPADVIFTVAGFHVTNTIITAYVITAILALGTYFATRKAALVPSGVYNFVESIVEWMIGTVEEIAGQKNGRRFFVPVATIFLFVIACNYFGLLPIVNTIGVNRHDPAVHVGVVASGGSSFAVISPSATQIKDGEEDKYAKLSDDQKSKLVKFAPYFRSVNTDLNSPMALAFWSFVLVEFWGISTLGVRYFGKFLAFPPFAKGSGPIGIFVGFLELISELIRIVSFTFRLFGNIFAGDVLILFISFLVPFIAPVVFYGLETFVGFIQAAVFALLTLVFAVMAVESHDEGEHEAHETHGAHAEAAAH